MPFHLELGSEGHSFHGKAIVVNSQTGEHKTRAPLPLDLAKAQMKALENREHHTARGAELAKEHLKALEDKKKAGPPEPNYKGPRNKDGTPKKSTKAWGMYVRDRDRPKPEMMKTKHEGMREGIPEREGEGPKEVKAKAEEAVGEFDSPRVKAIYYLALWLGSGSARVKGLDKMFGEQEKEFGKSALFYYPDAASEFPGTWKYLEPLKKAGLIYRGVGISAWTPQEGLGLEPIFSVSFNEEKTAKEAIEFLEKDFGASILAKMKVKANREKVTEKELGIKRDDIEDVPAVPEAKKDALAEFIQKAPEDITGVDYGAKNKEGKLQQGVLTKMIGRENLDIIKSIITSCQGNSKTQSYARLCGAIRFIRNIGGLVENDSSDVKANTYEVYTVQTSVSQVSKDADMCMRILANHEKSILPPSGHDPKDMKKPLRVYMLLPTSRTLRLIDGQMPQGFNSNVGHTSGMGHARDNYKWQVDTSGMNLKTKAGKEKRDARLEACSRIAKGLLESMLASLKQGAYLYLDKGHKATEESKATEKAKAKAAFEIPQGEKNAVEVFLTEDVLISIVLAVTGDPKKASAKVEEYRAAGKLGKKIRLYQSNRGNKKVVFDYVKE
jgi:hypothetical protein